MSECSVGGCAKPARTRGYCNTHYSRWRIHGDPLGGQKHYSEPAAAIAARSEWQGGCLVWNGARTPEGYGHMKVQGAGKRVHRVSWELENGEIPEGMFIDHVCHNPPCVNVEHLRLATPAQNASSRSGAREGSLTGVRNVKPYGSRFQVCINHRGAQYRRAFDTLEEAADHAAHKRAELFGEYAGKG